MYSSHTFFSLVFKVFEKFMNFLDQNCGHSGYKFFVCLFLGVVIAEVLSVCPGSLNATVAIGLTQKGFRPGHEPGYLDKSIGYTPFTGRSLFASI